MRLIQPDPAAALLGLRAMKTVVSAGGAIKPAERAMMDAAQKVILRTNHDIDALPPITAAELAKGFPGAELRQQFVNGMMVTALADGVPSRETVARIEEFAGALGHRRARAHRHPAAGRGPHAAGQARLPAARAHQGHLQEPARAEGPARPRQVGADDARRDGGQGAQRTLPRLGEAARGDAGPQPGRFLQQERLCRAGRARRLPGGGPVPRFLPSAGRLQHRAGGRDPGRLLHRGVQARAAVLYRAVRGDDLQRRRPDAPDQRRLRDGRASWASPAWPRACWPRSSAAPR